MKIITAAQLVDLLRNAQAGFVSIVTKTEPKMNKTHRETKVANPYLGRVERMAFRHGIIGASYENAVNNRREAEGHEEAGEFRAEALWNGAGEHVEGCKTLVRHRASGKLYMVFYPRQDKEGVVQVKEDMWTCDGQEIEVEALKPYLPPVKEGSPRQETERPVAWRIVAIENVHQITVSGETYMVSHR